jgi:hypothetical protein
MRRKRKRYPPCAGSDEFDTSDVSVCLPIDRDDPPGRNRPGDEFLSKHKYERRIAADLATDVAVHGSLASCVCAKTDVPRRWRRGTNERDEQSRRRRSGGILHAKLNGAPTTRDLNLTGRHRFTDRDHTGPRRDVPPIRLRRVARGA